MAVKVVRMADLDYYDGKIKTLIDGYVDTDELASALTAYQPKGTGDGAYVTVADLAAAGYQTASDVASAIGGSMATVLEWKGVKATVAELDAIAFDDRAVGDVWHVTADGGEYAWDGEAWQALGGAVDLSGYLQASDLEYTTNADIDALFAEGE